MFEMSRSAYVSLAQRYWNFDWDEARNRRVYGAQASPFGVGANLRVVLSVADERDLGPGAARIKELADHRALFDDLPEFRTRASTLERVTEFLAAHHGAPSVTRLAVHEDERLSCVVDPRGRLTLRERVFNLTLETPGRPDAASGLIRERDLASRAVRAVMPDFARPAGETRDRWARRLFAALAERLPGLDALDVTLDPYDTVRVTAQHKGDSHA